MKPFWSSFFGRAVIGMTALDAVATLVLVGLGRSGWLLGLWGSAGWFWLNAFLLWRITALVPDNGKMPERAAMAKWALVKFPVLYLLGFGFVLVPGVNLAGVFVTATAFLFGMAAALLIGAGKTTVQEQEKEKIETR